MNEPMVIFDAFGANFGDNAQGLDATWRTSPATRINELIAFASGITRYIGVSMPQGATSGNTFCVTAQEVLPVAVASWLTNDAPKLKAQGWKLVLYTGSRMPRVGGTGSAEQNATSQAAGAEVGSIPFTASDVEWMCDNCLADFAPSFSRVIFDAMSDTNAQLDAIDAARTAFRSRGWFADGVLVEPNPVDYTGSPRPNTINAARALRCPSYFTDDFWAARDNAEAPIANPQVDTWRNLSTATASHFAVGATFARYGPSKGIPLLNRMKAAGFTISFLGVPTADWIRNWARNAYGARVRGGRA